jgi:serine/threonine protein kinase
MADRDEIKSGPGEPTKPLAADDVAFVTPPGAIEPSSTVSFAGPASGTSIDSSATNEKIACLAIGAADAAPRVRIPHHEILEEVARGGMGVVYKARHAELNRTVALKMILAGDFASPEAVERFRAEARAVAQLEHSGIVPIYDIGEVGGQHYFAMQYIAGGTLSRWLAGGPLAPPLAARIVQQISEAVHHAHSRGIIHRDLKPGNVLLDETGQPKVTDFGLAKHIRGTQQLSATGDVMGTPPYMAPEQASGKVHEIGPATDVYALGAILYATLTGRPPFQAASPIETLRHVSHISPAETTTTGASGSSHASNGSPPTS